MTRTAPACTKCSTPIPAEFVNTGKLQACPGCDAPLLLEVFPAAFRETAKGQGGEALLADTEASCFYHPAKRAAVVCAGCGRFLCSLCDLELEGAHYCATCLQAAQEKNKIASIENRRTLYDVIVFQLGLVGLLIFYFSPFTAPAAIYLTVKHWRSPQSIVRKRSRWRMIVGVSIAVLQLLGWLALAGYLITR
jgi:hypothetical protein